MSSCPCIERRQTTKDQQENAFDTSIKNETEIIILMARQLIVQVSSPLCKKREQRKQTKTETADHTVNFQQPGHNRNQLRPPSLVKPLVLHFTYRESGTLAIEKQLLDGGIDDGFRF